MEFHHVPVLLNEVLEWMAPQPGGVYCDGTLGGGGHSSQILKLAGETARLYGIDRDPNAIAAASARCAAYPGFKALRGNFHDGKQLLEEAGAPLLNGVLLDLGVSSHQLDEGSRGFSYHEDAPLDMRMNPEEGVNAADLCNTLSEQELTRIISDYGEEKWASRIAKMICEHRREKPFATTFDLVHAVDAAIPKAVRRKDDGHPARRTFQALRIAVNDELDPLDTALCDFVDCLQPGGRLLVITFHSLEDRIVKRCFRRLQNPCTCPPKMPVCVCGKKPVVRVLADVAPSKEEIAENPRSRSARLRVCEKL